MFVNKLTQKRCNPFSPFTSEDGTRYNQMPADLYEEIPDPTPPEDYSDDTYYRVEVEVAPYVTYTRKSDEQIAAVRWEKLKVIRDDLTENGGCLLDGKWFHTDVRSKQQQIALVMMGANLPADTMWKTMDGSFVLMTPALAAAIFTAQMAREMTIFALAEQKKIDTSDINEGWPVRYEAALT
jgi:hypothetical protein